MSSVEKLIMVGMKFSLMRIDLMDFQSLVASPMSRQMLSMAILTILGGFTMDLTSTSCCFLIGLHSCRREKKLPSVEGKGGRVAKETLRLGKGEQLDTRNSDPADSSLHSTPLYSWSPLLIPLSSWTPLLIPSPPGLPSSSPSPPALPILIPLSSCSPSSSSPFLLLSPPHPPLLLLTSPHPHPIPCYPLLIPLPAIPPPIPTPSPQPASPRRHVGQQYNNPLDFTETETTLST